MSEDSNTPISPDELGAGDVQGASARSSTEQSPSTTPRERFAVMLVEDDGWAHFVMCVETNPEKAVDEAFETLSVATARKIAAVSISDTRTWQMMEVPSVG